MGRGIAAGKLGARRRRLLSASSCPFLRFGLPSLPAQPQRGATCPAELKAGRILKATLRAGMGKLRPAPTANSSAAPVTSPGPGARQSYRPLVIPPKIPVTPEALGESKEVA